MGQEITSWVKMRFKTGVLECVHLVSPNVINCIFATKEQKFLFASKEKI